MEAVIQTEKLSKQFGGKRVVDRLDLFVPRGAIYALLGDNGAGKSTTIKMLTGLLAPDSGKATILEQDCWQSAYPLRLKIGYVPEKPRYYDWMTVREIGKFTSGFHRAGFFNQYLATIDRFGLEHGAKLTTLSKGGYAKVGLALALAVDPEVLILDEPTSGLDLFTRQEFLSSMVELAGEGRTILISSHAVAEIERVASHVGFLAEGRLLLEGSLDELRQRLLRVRVRHADAPHEPSGLGMVLEQESSGREWQAVVLDPDRVAVEDLRHREGILELEHSPLKLEEMYLALLARSNRKPNRNGNASTQAAVVSEKGERP